MAGVTIKIKVNRIYFERFEILSPYGKPKITEIRLEWERAATAIIEKAGFGADLETTHVGHNTTPSVFVNTDEVSCKYAKDEGKDVRAYDDLVVLVKDYGKMVAEKAIEAGENAAEKQSEIIWRINYENTKKNTIQHNEQLE